MSDIVASNAPRATPTYPHFGRSAACAVLLVLFGPGFVQTMRPALTPPRDFFQDWAAARNWTHGQPIYGDLREAVRDYLRLDLTGDQLDGFVEVNGHPPTALWPALPLAGLDFRTAFLVWDVVSLALVVASVVCIARELEIKRNLQNLLTAVGLALLCNPLWQLLSQGQFGGLLLFLLTGAWLADRRGRAVWAGVAVGLATAIKLYPGLIIAYWLVTGQWSRVLSAAATLLVVAAATAAAFGIDSFVVYHREVMPRMQVWFGSGLNVSLTGFWHRLFHEPGSVFAPLVADGSIARLGTAVSCLAVLAVWAAVAWRGRKSATPDAAWAVTLVAMTLVSPLAWDHHLLVLALPLAWAWRESRDSLPLRAVLTIVGVCIWFSPVVVWRFYLGERFGRTILSPGESLTIFSFQCYAIVALFVVTARLAWQTCAAPLPHSAPRACVLQATPTTC